MNAAMKNISIFTGILAVSLGSTLALGQEEPSQGKEKTDNQKIREKLRGGSEQGSPQGKRPDIKGLGDNVEGTLKSIMKQLDLAEDQKEAFMKAHREFADEKKEIAERKGTTVDQKREKYEAMQEAIKEHRENIGKILNDEQKAKLRELFEKAGKSQRAEDGEDAKKQERHGKQREGGQEKGKQREGGQEKDRRR